MALVAGRNLVPSQAVGIIAFFTFTMIMRSFSLFQLLVIEYDG